MSKQARVTPSTTQKSRDVAQSLTSTRQDDRAEWRTQFVKRWSKKQREKVHTKKHSSEKGGTKEYAGFTLMFGMDDI